MKNVDIVIPVYNAFDFTKKCIETVIENTDLTKHTLLVINDKSKDERILPMLNEFKEKYKELNIEIHDNENNLGFVKNVNIGLMHSKNDVILLNSDTEVTKNWLEKLQRCAYLRENVATATPISNNATLASVPVFNAENEIPKGMTVQEYADFIEKCSMREYPEIPTAHGFCMYIKREVIEEIGIFDDVTFEKGYGEENDFSYRCLEAGYIHLLCDDTFIYHKGTQSFSEAKLQFILSHLDILREKYPTCYLNTDNFVRNNPIERISQNVMYSLYNEDRKNILMFVHDFRRKEEKNLGGTTLHMYDLIDGLRDKFNFHVVYYNLHDGMHYVRSFFKEEEATYRLGKYYSYTPMHIYSEEFKKDVEILIKFLKIDIVHVHHVKNLYLDVFDVAKENNIKVIYTLHDFYSICPTIQLLDEDGHYCNNLKEKNCAKCMKAKFNINFNIINVWQKHFLRCLRMCDKLIVPSNSTKELFDTVYKDLKIDVIEHGFNKKELKTQNKNDNKYNVAFIGGINQHKGLKYLKGLLKKVEGTNIVIHLFGETDDKRYNKNRKNYVFHGAYSRENIVKLLNENNIKLACMLQIWPETYSYILTESLTAKVPVICLNIGAVAERVKNIDAGYIVDANSSIDEIFSKIVDIKNNKEEYNKKIKNITKFLNNMKSIEEMCKEYYDIYSSYITKDKNINYDIIKAKKDFYKRFEYVRKSEFDELSHSYYWIVNSKRWKAVRRLRWPKIMRKK